jgi:hypothetical protein
MHQDAKEYSRNIYQGKYKGYSVGQEVKNYRYEKKVEVSYRVYHNDFIECFDTEEEMLKAIDEKLESEGE